MLMPKKQSIENLLEVEEKVIQKVVMMLLLVILDYKLLKRLTLQQGKSKQQELQSLEL